MFANLLLLTLREPGGEKPVPEGWIEQFFMRDFTGPSAFDDTLVAGDGRLEAGFSVTPEAAREPFEKWLRGRRMIPLETVLEVRVAGVRSAPGGER
jgi:hypothetical protein